MDVIENLVGRVALPKMAPARQIFAAEALGDVEAALRQEFSQKCPPIEKGATIALGVGSRGLADLPLLVRTTVDELKSRGANVFIVPSMGSHGGATAEGQEKLLAGLGITEASVGAPIRSSMEVVTLGHLPNGLPICIDKCAMEADGIAFIGRVKPHTSFSGEIESGLAKMITIGLGKQIGADSAHAMGFSVMEANVVDMARYKLANTKIIFGIASVENAYDRISMVELVLPDGMIEREKELLRIARANMPKIQFNPIDVLIVDKMGKEFSGTGMDPNVTGRAGTPYIHPELKAGRLVILDLSLKSGGNATGLGLADITTRRLVDKIDYAATYANHITSTVMSGAKVPMTLPTDELAIKCAVKTCNGPEPGRLRIVRIPNTLHVEHIFISEALVEEAKDHPGIEVLGPAEPFAFDNEGALALA